MSDMKIYTEAAGNIYQPEWSEPLRNAEIEYVELDQWTAQKSRFVVRGDRGGEYAVALKRHSRLLDGDILCYDGLRNRAAVVRIRLSEVMVIDFSALEERPAEELLQRAVELGHAIGNQHWPAVVRGGKVYVPLTVDRRVMLGVMDTHHIEGVGYRFRPGDEVLPYLAPHEVRRLFGGTEHAAHADHRHAESEPEAVHG